MCCKNILMLEAQEMAQLLQVSAALAGDQGSILSTYTEWVIIPNSSMRVSNVFCWPWCVLAHMHTKNYY